MIIPKKQSINVILFWTFWKYISQPYLEIHSAYIYYSAAIVY